MSVYIVCNGTTYSDIKSVSFAPEDDLTLNTLPICQFSVDVVTSAAADSFKGKYIHLYESRIGNPILLAGKYTVTEAEQVTPGVVRIIAKSFLDYLDSRTLSAKIYSGVSSTNFLIDIFSGPAEDETSGTIEWDTDDPQITGAGGTLYGFFPKQTARERLQMFCQAHRYYVAQWGPDSASGLKLVLRTASTFTNGDYILPEDVYMRPTVKRVSDVGILRIYGTSSYSTSYARQEDGYEKYVITEGWTDPSTGLTQGEQAIYYKRNMYEFTSSDGTDGVSEIKNNLYMNTSQAQNIPFIKLAHFARYEVELETLCTYDMHSGVGVNRVWHPDSFVNFCIDDSGQRYCGVVRSAEYTFGKMTKAKLKIVTDMVPADTGTLILDFNCSGYGTIMQRTYHLPPNQSLYMYLPQKITCWIADNVVNFKRHSNSVSSFYAPSAGNTTTYQVTYDVDE